ncbi:murein biosynthesis integral membrane protein MurJ [Rathayibacter tritici]|uniref:murein biosynthesis integral membrane protein MurJ n=1 Tax=Rathayibacter tritici TaxID=33888 RepID=UPI000CE859FB|nr:murein biosynthesis integral membrane protein MurJ [Rathayibacter tritici]PPF29525.1 murein biosynthesis integral membrane protein MurJ [Rathayibacter tritici]PPI18301.1 murein biosynthesis integral membrane protein MurJ [Rathayibacter tritici]
MASFSLGRASAVLASGTMVSRILGFVMSIVMANTIGAAVAPGADAFTTANLLPNTIYSIIAGGALNAVLVPQIVRAGLDADGGRGYINRLLTLALGLLLVTTVAATLLAPLLARLYAPGYGPEQYQLAVAFAFWCLPQVFFYGLFTILGEVLNARGSFGPFTWAPVLNNVVVIAGLLAFMLLFGADPDGDRPVESWTSAMVSLLAGSATLGIVVQSLFLMLFWRKVGLSYRPDFRFRGVGLGTAGRMSLWSFATVLLTIGAGIVESRVSSIASGEGPSAAALQKAWLIFMLPHSVIAISIAMAYFTKMSGHTARGEMKEFRSDVSTSLRLVLMMLVFAAAAIVVVAVPFGSVFTDRFADAQAIGAIATAYVIALPLFSSIAIVQRAFYALSDGLRPFLFTLVQVVVAVIGYLVVLRLPVDQVAIGIAAATSLGICVQAVVAALLLRRRLGGTGGRRILVRLVQFTIAAVPSAAVGYGVLVALGGTRPDGFAVSNYVEPLLSMAVIGTAMALVYVAVLWFLRVPELRALLAPVLRRLGR